jgi:predicted membrane-bound spermidine synthase
MSWNIPGTNDESPTDINNNSSFIFSKAFLQTVTGIVLALGCGISTVVFVYFILIDEFTLGIIVTLSAVIGTFVTCYFFVLGVLHIDRMEEINESILELTVKNQKTNSPHKEQP